MIVAVQAGARAERLILGIKTVEAVKAKDEGNLYAVFAAAVEERL